MSYSIDYDACGNETGRTHHGANESFYTPTDPYAGTALASTGRRPSQPQLQDFPPLGWARHPTSPGYYFQGMAVLSEVELRARAAGWEPHPSNPDYFLRNEEVLNGSELRARMAQVRPPPNAPIDLASLRAGQRLPAGARYSTVLADWDFETYSEAGFEWDARSGKYKPPLAAKVKGLPAVGSAVYTQHPSIEVLSLQYDLKDGLGARFWRPGMPLPADLIAHLGQFDPSAPASYEQAGLIEAHTSMFELRVATEALTKKYGWPAIHLRQMRCSMAKCRAHALPGALGDVGKVLQIKHQKDTRGTALIKRFTHPRDPTSKDPRHRIDPATDDQGPDLYAYNKRDIEAEAEVSAQVPDLQGASLEYWLADQAINLRGVGVDLQSVQAGVAVLQQALTKYDAELLRITGGQVPGASKVAQLKTWLAEQGVYVDSLDSDAVDEALERPDLSAVARRALEIRQLVGSASVKKIYSMARMSTREQRLCDLFVFHGSRTGRDTHSDVQPGNLPKAGPAIKWCEDTACGKPYAKAASCCPWCGTSAAFSKPGKWGPAAVDSALEILNMGNLELVEWFFGDALLTISGCVRGMFVAAPGKELICSDYSSIEAVTLAMLSGEQWRIDAFRRQEDIYYHGAAAVSGKTYQFYADYFAEHKEHHADRNLLGKIAELSLQYGGWLAAWRQFDKTDNFEDKQVTQNIVKWRAASPMFVELWGGQFRGVPWAPERSELYGLEGAIVAAIQNPGQAFGYRGIHYLVHSDVLYCRLLSGRLLTYHKPRLRAMRRKPDWPEILEITFEGWNTNPKKGARGWIRMPLHGPLAAENINQGTAFDKMAAAVVRLEAAGYPVVLRVHDELASEVPKGYGSVEEYEALMSQDEPWSAGWPIRAAGGWRGTRYRKG